MNRIKEIRTQKGISQIALFSMTRIWPCIISYLERGYLPASVEQQEKLSAALGIPQGLLFPKRSNGATRSGRKSCERSAMMGASKE